MNENDYQIEFKTSPRQLALAERILSKIFEAYPDATGHVSNDHGFILVKATQGEGLYRRDWMIKVGIRGGLKDCYNNKVVKSWHVENNYRFW